MCNILCDIYEYVYVCFISVYLYLYMWYSGTNLVTLLSQNQNVIILSHTHT